MHEDHLRPARLRARARCRSFSPCPLRPLVDEAHRPPARTKRGHLVNDVPEDLPVPSLDKDQFRQVLINLLQNAVEAIPSTATARSS